MPDKRESRISWKKELAALVLGLLLGSAWEAAHAEARSAPYRANGQTSRAAPAPRS